MYPSRLVLFDLDYTLLDGDSESMWSSFLFEKKVVDKVFLSHITDYYQAYEQGQLDIYEYEAFLLGPLTKLPVERLHALRKEYMEHVRQVVRVKMMQEVNRFRKFGYMLLLITAANSFIAEPIAELLNFPHLICTEIKLNNGQYTTELDGIPAFREGKSQRLDQFLSREGITLNESWGYSDSHNDLSILNRVEHPVAVMPDSVLRTYANQHGWKIIDG